MKIKFWGVRGSYPVPGPDTIRYGGNTSCVSITNEVDDKIDRIIIDSGTGIIGCGKEIINNHFAGKEALNIMMLFTHLHPDHNQGFPFFSPNYFKDCHIDLYGMETLQKNVGQVLKQTITPPTFPIEWKDLKSDRKHIILNDGQTFLSPLKSMEITVMQSYAPSHPQQGCMYYKIRDLANGNQLACIWDLESKVGGDMMVINFIKGCKTVIHDTQYTEDEYKSDKIIVQGYGHSTYGMAIDNIRQAGVKNLICFHYNPAHTDNTLDAISKKLANNTDITISMAKEGMLVSI